MLNTILRRAAAAAIAALSALPMLTMAAPQHGDEIRAYAVLTAMALTASDRCTDIRVNNTMIRTAPDYFHITPKDEPGVRFAYDLEMPRLAAAIDAAPSLQA